MKLASLSSQIEYQDNKPAIKVLLDNEYHKEIRIVFRKGQLMKAHKTGFPIVVEIFEGAIDFGVYDEVLQLIKGDLISLPPNITHDLKASKESIVRLSLSKYDTTSRVKKVAL